MLDDNDVGLFSNLSFLNKVALSLFVAAKFFGLVGISLGFIGSKYLQIGGITLTMSLVFIFSAVVCGLIQTSKDKQKFKIEDETRDHLKRLNETKIRLEKEVKDLEEQRSAVNKFLMSK